MQDHIQPAHRIAIVCKPDDAAQITAIQRTQGYTLVNNISHNEGMRLLIFEKPAHADDAQDQSLDS